MRKLPENKIKANKKKVRIVQDWEEYHGKHSTKTQPQMLEKSKSILSIDAFVQTPVKILKR